MTFNFLVFSKLTANPKDDADVNKIAMSTTANATTTARQHMQRRVIRCEISDNNEQPRRNAPEAYAKVGATTGVAITLLGLFPQAAWPAALRALRGNRWPINVAASRTMYTQIAMNTCGNSWWRVRLVCLCLSRSLHTLLPRGVRISIAEYAVRAPSWWTKRWQAPTLTGHETGRTAIEPRQVYHRVGDVVYARAVYLLHQVPCAARGATGLAARVFAARPYANCYASTAAPGHPGAIQVLSDVSGENPVVNLFGQFREGPPRAKSVDTRKIRVYYFRTALNGLSEYIRKDGKRYARVAVPHGIGCGSAGGYWSSYLAELIDWVCEHNRVNADLLQLLIYKLPV